MAAVTAAGSSGVSAGSAAVAGLVMVAAVGRAVVGMPSGNVAALHSTQGQTYAVAIAGLMAAAAVGHTVVDVPSGNVAVLHGAQRQAFAVAHAAHCVS